MIKLPYQRDWKALPPNKPVCECGKTVWYVSAQVLRRPLDCLECGRMYFYERDADMSYTITLVGRYKSKAERERRIAENARKAESEIRNQKKLR